MQETPLTVYKASAGSGKTFTLAVEYLKLLIEDPSSYRHILAVTFTNKATEEMKMRILSQLNGLANGYEDSNDYLEKICNELGKDKDFVRERAQKALTFIIHHYHYFRVETIDKFFQRVLRNLAHELDLTANLRIELDEKHIEQLAVDMLISELKGNDPVMKWLMKYIQNNISTDKSWNVIGNIKDFGKNIFNDKYKQHQADMNDIMSKQNIFEDFSGELYALKTQSEQEIEQYAQQFFDITKDYTIDDFYKKKNSAYSFFERLKKGEIFKEPSNTVKSFMDSSSIWGHKESPHYSAINALACSILIDLLKTTEKVRSHNAVLIKTINVVLKNLYQLRLLISIEEKVRVINQEFNQFLLSDTQGLLRELIGDNDTPFIFEKIGTTLHHIMIDEFQDTGRLQWKNFKILLRNCIDQGMSSLIVGDVKQSIYRWRSGDWRLLNGIEKQFNPGQLKVTKLRTNFRSSRHVITFNNVFFQTAEKKEYERLEKYLGEDAKELHTAYNDVKQDISPKKSYDGYVKVELLPYEEYHTSVMEHISQTIHTILDSGVDQNKIAILARTRDDINDTTMYFHENEPEIHIVSDEAFHLDSSIAIDILITSLRVLCNPDDQLSRATLAKNYQNVVLKKDISDSLLSQLHDRGGKLLDAWLPETFIGDANRQRLLSLPLNEIFETLYDIFQLERIESQAAYISAFYDKLNSFLTDNTNDVETFLKEWDENIGEKDIQGAQVDGIRMVTIHKSKGLEFDHVILPFCNWKLEIKRNNIIWCDSDKKPFNKLPILPVDYNNSLEGTYYEDDFKYEHLQNSVDNLNLLYVAFTRAKNSLFIMGQQKKPNKEDASNKKNKGAKNNESESSEKLVHITRSELIRQCLSEVNEQLPGSTLQTLDNGTIVLEYGSPDNINIKEQKEKKPTENVFLQKEQEQFFTINSNLSKAQFLQSNASKAFTNDEEISDRRQYIVRGTLLHSIFSRLHDINDINRVLEQLKMEGVLYDEISPNELQDMLQQALSDEQVRSWFSPKWEVHNECAILFHDPDTNTVVERRPDRVISDDNQIIVIDFKFGKPQKDHRSQVQLYMEKFRQMDSRTVKGYLWYVSQQKVVKI